MEDPGRTDFGGRCKGKNAMTQTTIPGVNGQVILAGSEMTDEQKQQPEWLWHESHRYATSYGRWQDNPSQAPYIRADLVLEMLKNART